MSSQKSSDDQAVKEPEQVELDQLDPTAVIAGLPTVDGDGKPVPFLLGTFALYRDDSGGVMGVFDIDGQSLVGEPGVKHLRAPAGLLRAATALFSGRGALGKLMGRFGRGGA